MNWQIWLAGGFIATLVLNGVMAGTQALRLTRINLPFMLGTIFTSNRRRAKVIGFVFHMGNGWIFALIYGYLFHVWGAAGIWRGLLFGFIHGAWVLLVGMWLLPALHPRMADEQRGPTVTRQLEPPGFLAIHYGWPTPISVLGAHLIFGLILGFAFGLG